MATLYEINKWIEDYPLEIDPETGEITNADGLEALQLERDAKIENIALYIKNLKAEANMYADEEKVFAQRKKTAQNKAEALTRYLDTMLHGERFKSAKTAITYRKSEAVEVVSIDAIPPEYVVTHYTPDKAAIKKAIKNGEEVPGAELVERSNIQVK